jgi:hypothetical protein
MTTVRIVSRRAIGVLAVVAAVGLVGCSSGTSPSAIASAIANASAPPAASSATPAASSAAASAAPSEPALPSAVVTDIDPCQLVTSADASSFVGVKFGAGKESTTEGNARICTYAAPGPNLFTVEVAIAPDEATAKAAEAAQEKDLESQAADLASLGLTVTKLPNFAPSTDAALMQGALSAAGQSIAARAMFVLRGTTYFGFSDVAVGGGQPPSEQAMKDEAMTLLGKVP